MNRKLWMIFVAIWFVLYGLLAISNFRFDLQNVVMGVVAIVGGVLLALDR